MTVPLHHIHRIHLKGELNEVYINLALRNFALSMITVFVPIYLLNLGYSLNQAILYQLTLVATTGIFSPIIAYLTSKMGIKHTVAVSIPLTIIQMALLYTLNFASIPIYLIGFLGGFAVTMYWIPLNSDFAINSNKRVRGGETGILQAVSQAARLLGPFLGAVVLGFYNFNILFLVVILMLILSAIPLFWTLDIKRSVDLRPKIIFARKHFKYLIKFIAQGAFFTAEKFAWPLFIFFFALDTFNVGVAASLKGVGAIIFALGVGKLADIKSKRFLIKIGAVLYGILWIFRQYFVNSLDLFIFSFAGGLLLALINIPFFAKVSDSANKEDVLEFMTFRQMGLGIGRTIFLIIMLLAVEKFLVTFNVSSISTIPFIIW